MIGYYEVFLIFRLSLGVSLRAWEDFVKSWSIKARTALGQRSESRRNGRNQKLLELVLIRRFQDESIETDSEMASDIPPVIFDSGGAVAGQLAELNY